MPEKFIMRTTAVLLISSLFVDVISPGNVSAFEKQTAVWSAYPSLFAQQALAPDVINIDPKPILGTRRKVNQFKIVGPKREPTKRFKARPKNHPDNVRPGTFGESFWLFASEALVTEGFSMRGDEFASLLRRKGYPPSQGLTHLAALKLMDLVISTNGRTGIHYQLSSVLIDALKSDPDVMNRLLETAALTSSNLSKWEKDRVASYRAELELALAGRPVTDAASGVNLPVEIQRPVFLDIWDQFVVEMTSLLHHHGLDALVENLNTQEQRRVMSDQLTRFLPLMQQSNDLRTQIFELIRLTMARIDREIPLKQEENLKGTLRQGLLDYAEFYAQDHGNYAPTPKEFAQRVVRNYKAAGVRRPMSNRTAGRELSGLAELGFLTWTSGRYVVSPKFANILKLRPDVIYEMDRQGALAALDKGELPVSEPAKNAAMDAAGFLLNPTEMGHTFPITSLSRSKYVRRIANLLENYPGLVDPLLWTTEQMALIALICKNPDSGPSNLAQQIRTKANHVSRNLTKMLESIQSNIEHSRSHRRSKIQFTHISFIVLDTAGARPKPVFFRYLSAWELRDSDALDGAVRSLIAWTNGKQVRFNPPAYPIRLRAMLEVLQKPVDKLTGRDINLLIHMRVVISPENSVEGYAYVRSAFSKESYLDVRKAAAGQKDRYVMVEEGLSARVLDELRSFEEADYSKSKLVLHELDVDARKIVPDVAKDSTGLSFPDAAAPRIRAGHDNRGDYLALQSA